MVLASLHFQTLSGPDFASGSFNICFILQVREEQVTLLGSENVYRRMDRNLRESRFEPFFAKEQFELYSWREEFFHSQFPEETWFTDGADDSHDFDTVPFQITARWDSVVALASSSKRPTEKTIYFENDESKSGRARTLFDSNTVLYNDQFLERDYLEEHGLSYSDAVHVILAVFPAGPAQLQLTSMRAVLGGSHSQPTNRPLTNV